MSSKKFCSLDIETTGFDPLKDEILEIGFAFFILEKSGINITEEYSKVFKPVKEVSETILALTGISKQELENAESFKEAREEIQEKIKNVVLIGHNIQFDVKFLESLGLKLSGKYIDTLDLAQFILPIHPSYNLENLMHYFGVPHIEAHRALADAKAVLKVLEGMLGIYSNFSKQLKYRLLEFIEKLNPHWQSFLTEQFDMVGREKPIKHFSELPKVELKLKPNHYYNFNQSSNILPTVASAFLTGRTKALLIAPTEKDAFLLWKEFGVKAELGNAWTFNGQNFQRLIQKQQLETDELKFILKILVWLNTNWQTKYWHDLNLSFFGGQFKHIISGGATEENKKEKLIACSINSFFEFMKQGWHKNRQIVFFAPDAMERALIERLSEKISWSQISSVLKSIYNHEDRTGNEAFSKEAEEGLKASDLFFGVVNALLGQSEISGYRLVKLDADSLPDAIVNKIQMAMDNFALRLSELNKIIGSDLLQQIIIKLEKYFNVKENCVKWLELNTYTCVFHSSPVKIDSFSKEIFSYAKKTLICGSMPKLAWGYIQARLGLGKYKFTQTEPLILTNRLDLFSFAKKSKPDLVIEAKDLTEPDASKLIKAKSLPAVVLFPNSASVKNFYHTNYQRLQEDAFVLAQLGAGNSRLLRNFGIHPNSLLLATDKFILKYSTGLIGLGTNIKTLVIGRLPFEQYTHPYLETVSKGFNNSFEDFSIPRALINLNKLLNFFYNPDLKTIALYDPKVSRLYGKGFVDFLKQFVDKSD